MCGRYGLPDDHPVMQRSFDIKVDLRRDIDWKALMPRHNVTPTDQVPVIVQKKENGSREVESMRWGLVPRWTVEMKGRSARDNKGKSINTPINARAETVHSNGLFKRPFEKRRCIIPAGGFYEWQKAGDAKVPHWVYLTDGRWMGFAGLYNAWKSPDDTWVLSCTIVTTSANRFMEPIHSRMPVILTEGAYDIWLDRKNEDLSELKEVLVPYPSDEMRAHKVAPLVNNAKNDGPELIIPLG